MEAETVLEEDGYNVVPDDEPEYQGPGEKPVAEKPTKEAIKVAKWMKKNVRCKKTKLLNHNVEYFTASKAIDSLLKSKFAEKDNAYFTTREEVVEFLDTMLSYKFFHRALKVPIAVEPHSGGNNQGNNGSGNTKSSKKDKDKKDDGANNKEKDKINTANFTSSNSSSLHNRKANSNKDNKEKEKPKNKESDKERGVDQVDSNTNLINKNEENEGESLTTPNSEKTPTTTGSTEEIPQQKKEKRKRKIRLDMHPEQVFVDGSDAYVWIYDPIPVRYWFYGMILLLGAIGVCLFPLWPPIMRKGVLYLSQAAAGFFVLILALTLIRLIIFTVIWAISAGRLHFWLLPNLTEDVGFFASFWPLYDSKYCKGDESSSTSHSSSSKKTSNNKSLKKSKKKAKDSDAEDNEADELCADGEENLVYLEAEKIDEIKEHDADLELKLAGASSVDGANNRKNSSDVAQTETEEERGNSSGNSSAAEANTGESDAKRSQTPSESESDGKDYEIISTNEVQNIQ